MALTLDEIDSLITYYLDPKHLDGTSLYQVTRDDTEWLLGQAREESLKIKDADSAKMVQDVIYAFNHFDNQQSRQADGKAKQSELGSHADAVYIAAGENLVSILKLARMRIDR